MKDKLNRDLQVNDIVAATYLGEMRVYRVIGFTPQKVKLQNYFNTFNKNPEETVLVDITDATGMRC